jgi:hypothetical protein
VRAENTLNCVRHWLVGELACIASMRRSLSLHRAETVLRNVGDVVALGGDDVAPGGLTTRGGPSSLVGALRPSSGLSAQGIYTWSMTGAQMSCLTSSIDARVGGSDSISGPWQTRLSWRRTRHD